MGFLDDLRRRGTAKAYQALVERIPYARFLGIAVEAVEHGQLVTRLRFSDRVVGNPNLPAIHGGVLGAFLEVVALLQLVAESEGEHLPKPINLTVEYLRSAGPRDLVGRAVITKHGRRVANVRAQAWQEDPTKPVAAGHGHFLLPQE